MPPTAITTPKRLLSSAPRPLVIHPNATIDSVFEWPTTVLATGPAPSIMTNCDKLIAEAQSPLYRDEVSDLRSRSGLS